MICVTCGTTVTCRWYGGSTCNRCHGIEFRTKNPEYHRKYQRTQYHGNLSFRINDSKRKKKRYKDNKVQIIAQKLVYQKRRLQNDVLFKMERNLRARLNKAVKRNYKSGSAVNDLGCSVVKLKMHLQLKFHRDTRGKHEYMTWDNYGKWHIDHVKPLSSFDLTSREQLLIACNFTNLQPLWKKDNLIKSDKSE